MGKYPTLDTVLVIESVILNKCPTLVQYDTLNDVMLFVGHCELYFIVQ